MITNADVTKLKKTFLTKADFAKLSKTFATKEDFHELSSQISHLTFLFGEMQYEVRTLAGRMDVMEEVKSSMLHIVEGLATPLQDLRLEYAATSVQTTRLNEWAVKVAEKVDVPFDY